MPVAVIDPTVHAQGAIPPSPISSIMQGLIAQQASMYPTPLERSEIQMRQAETQKLQNELAAPGQLEDLFSKAYGQLGQGNGAPAQGGAQPGVVPAAQPTRDELVSSSLPHLAGTMARAGQYGGIGNMFRTFTANAPGITAVGSDPQHPSPVSMSMMGAGDAYTSTPDATLMGATPGQRDRNAKINDMMTNNPGMSRQTAANHVDGLIHTIIDPSSRNSFLVDEAQKTSELLHSPAQGTNPLPPGVAGTGGGSSSPAAAPSSASNAISTTLGLEGGYAPTDGATNAPVIYGINSLYHPNEFTKAKQITDTQGPDAGKAYAAQFYKQNYWDPNHLDQLDPKVAAVTFDGLVNHSPQFGQALLSAAHAGATPAMLLKMRQAEYNRLANNAPGTYGKSLPAWNQRLQTLAQSVGGGQQAAPAAGAAPAQPAQNPGFALKRGDLGIPFDSVYGGPATAARLVGGLTALGGNAEANGGATTALSALNNIKNQLISIKSLQPGMRTNASQQARFAQQLPPTDPQLLDKENLAEGATTGAGSAEDQINSALNQAVQDRLEDDKLLASPNTSVEERQFAEMRRDKTDKLFAGLPPSVKAMYQSAIGKTEVVPQSNLEKGQEATTVPSFENIPGQKTYTPNDIAYSAKLHNMTPQAVVDKLRTLGKVK